MITLLKQEHNQSTPRPFGQFGKAVGGNKDNELKMANQAIVEYGEAQPTKPLWYYWDMDRINSDAPVAVLVFRGGLVVMFYGSNDT